MGIPTLIKTLTASSDSSLSFVHGTADVIFDSTYDEYMFVFTDIGPESDAYNFAFQVSIDGGSNYNVTCTSASFDARHTEEGDGESLAYQTAQDQAQGTALQSLGWNIGNEADSSSAGILHIFNPTSTTYVKHFYGRSTSYTNDGGGSDGGCNDGFIAGYFNDADDDLNAITFKMTNGDFDGVIQMYGIA